MEEILTFLEDVLHNNNRPWFQEHKKQYQTAQANFNALAEQIIAGVQKFDDNCKGLTLKDCTYRFYRDTRFSADKSPYKNHFGAYINAKSKKALRGGYYLHFEPDHCLLAIGNYWLPTNILTSCRHEIMGNTAEWLRCVESPEFLQYFGSDATSSTKEPTNIDSWDQPQGFGLSKLKTCPAGFPKDSELIRYLRLKDYCCWHAVSDSFFEGDAWLDEMERIFRAAKPMMDFMNSVIDDYE